MMRLMAPGIVVLLLVLHVGGVRADTVTFQTQLGSLYLYTASQTDGDWIIDDTIDLSGMIGVFDVLTPSNFAAVFDSTSVTWTCIQNTSGAPTFGLSSNETTGIVPWSIVADDSSGSGTVTGPQYVPEPMSALLFSAGLAVLGVVGYRRRAAHLSGRVCAP